MATTFSSSQETNWNLLPDEIWLWILSFLDDFHLELCSLVSRRLRRLTRDPSLLSSPQKIRNGQSPEKVFLECCREGKYASIELLVRILTSPGRSPSVGYLILWSQGFLEATKGGHVSVARKMLYFGAVPLYEDSLLECCHRHLKMTQFLLEEAKFCPRILEKAKNKALEHHREDIASLLTKYLS